MKACKALSRLWIAERRLLTEGEKELAYSIFKDALRVEKIEIVAHRWVLKHYAISPNGHVYFNPTDWCEDFSQRSVAQQSWLIHELTHIWQIQQGLHVVRRALFDRQYSYVLEQGKSFLSYGIEQQAQMVQDYFLRKKQGKECQAYELCIPFLQNHNV